MAETLDPYSSAVYAPVEQRAFEGASTSYKSSHRGLLTGEADSLAARKPAKAKSAMILRIAIGLIIFSSSFVIYIRFIEKKFF